MDYEQSITITIKSKNKDTEKISVTYTDPNGLCGSDIFWSWFVDVWPMLGLSFVKNEIEKGKNND
jgi:hypothetical protein